LLNPQPNENALAFNTLHNRTRLTLGYLRSILNQKPNLSMSQDPQPGSSI
jgi:hypothetical protein